MQSMGFDDDDDDADATTRDQDTKEAYATDNPLNTSAAEQEEMAKKAVKKFKSLQG